MLTVKNYAERVRNQIQDASKRYWSDQDLVDYLNDGRNLLYSLSPKVYETTADVTLVDGTRQSLPDASNVFLRAIANVSAISQRAISTVDGELLARGRPRWRTEAARDEIVHVMYRDTEPRVYEVYPPAAAGTVIKISYAKPPAAYVLADLTDPSPTLSAEADLGEALVDYGLHRAFGKQADTSPDAGQMSGDYLKLFLTKVGTEEAAKMAKSTNATARGMKKDQP